MGPWRGFPTSRKSGSYQHKGLTATCPPFDHVTQGKIFNSYSYGKLCTTESIHVLLGRLVSIEITRDKHLVVARVDGSCGTGASEESYESDRVYGWDVFGSATAESVGE